MPSKDQTKSKNNRDHSRVGESRTRYFLAHNPLEQWDAIIAKVETRLEALKQMFGKEHKKAMYVLRDCTDI